MSSEIDASMPHYRKQGEFKGVTAQTSRATAARMRQYLGRMLDWDGLCGELATLLDATGKNDSKFAREVGINRSTVLRIRKGQSKPRLDTLERWLAACNGGPVATFIERFERLSNGQLVPPRNRGGVLDGYPLSAIVITPQIADAIEILSLAALAAVRREVHDRPLPGDRAEESETREGSAGLGGQDPEDV